jgi:integrase
MTVLKKERRRNSNAYLNQNQVTQTLNGASDPMENMLLELGFGSGPRVNEMASLQLDRINFKEGHIEVWDDKHHTYKGNKKDKNREIIADGKWRRIKISKNIMEDLQFYVENERKDYIRREDGTLWNRSYKTLETIIQKNTKQSLGIVKSWHCVRDTYITLTIHSRQKEGYTVDKILKYLSRQTGDTIAMLLDKYTAITSEEVEEIAERPLF